MKINYKTAGKRTSTSLNDNDVFALCCFLGVPVPIAKSQVESLFQQAVNQISTNIKLSKSDVFQHIWDSEALAPLYA